MIFTLGFSPCPNDTFIFDALINGKIDTKGIRFDYVMEDVETLNAWALEGRLDITKLSFNALIHCTDTYSLLDSGSALGRGVGPLLITAEAGCFDDEVQLRHYLKTARIAIPGVHTTANLLLSLAFPEAQNKTEVLFSEIENKVLSGEFDCGLIIHENRFTYQQKGLHLLRDMGAWWESTTGSAIPLGGICLRKNINRDLAQLIQELIRESIANSWNQYPDLSAFIKNHAQEMDEAVMRQHIELYVNSYTTSLGISGKHAVDTLFEWVKRAGIIPELPETLYV
jgi:1,4-dihydroxy-6-naphthoate synthase